MYIFSSFLHISSGFETLRPCVTLLFEISLIYTSTDARLSCLWAVMDRQSPFLLCLPNLLLCYESKICSVTFCCRRIPPIVCFPALFPCFAHSGGKDGKGCHVWAQSQPQKPVCKKRKKKERHRKTDKIKTVTHNRSANLNLVSERTHTSAARCGISQCYRLPASAESSGWNKCQVFINLYLARERWLISNNAWSRVHADGSCRVWVRPSGQSWDSKSVFSIILSQSSV